MSSICTSYSSGERGFVKSFSCPTADSNARAVFCCGFNDMKYCCDDPNSFFPYEYGYMWWLSFGALLGLSIAAVVLLVFVITVCVLCYLFIVTKPSRRDNGLNLSVPGQNIHIYRSTEQAIMRNIHHRVNMVLIAYLVMAMSAHAYPTPQENQSTASSELPMNSTSDGQNDSPGTAEAHSAWPIVLGVFTAVLSIGLLIALAVRYRFFRWCLTRNSPALLLEGETASQFSQAGDLEREIPVHGMRGRMIRRGESSDDDDDDDGFIEDNYIQANEREKAEEEEIQQEDTEDSDDELVIPDTIYVN
ncbi:uncharacterized protein LOC107719275 [Sinocyclocheilus rhinocerous]|uniref:uncharacterized protein LOC107719275 n=1 Tax=Sinocyclocheilus rhinocerous TaxID=307959 RepID=UPI0007B80625|nr:PREDICTED: uncharacterized protein LOC107719275 [Sinocyclocheilus rhinocerous]